VRADPVTPVAAAGPARPPVRTAEVPREQPAPGRRPRARVLVIAAAAAVVVAALATGGVVYARSAAVTATVTSVAPPAPPPTTSAAVPPAPRAAVPTVAPQPTGDPDPGDGS
jgi:hypothetical protein